MRINYSIVLVSDMDRSIEFYRDTLGIPLKFESPHWTEFKTDGATLALHLCAGPPADSELQQAESAGTCRAGFQVDDLDQFHARMIEHQLPCAQVPTETFGTRIAQYIDPDGLLFSVAQRPGEDNQQHG